MEHPHIFMAKIKTLPHTHSHTRLAHLSLIAHTHTEWVSEYTHDHDAHDLVSLHWSHHFHIIMCHLLGPNSIHCPFTFSHAVVYRYVNIGMENLCVDHFEKLSREPESCQTIYAQEWTGHRESFIIICPAVCSISAMNKCDSFYESHNSHKEFEHSVPSHHPPHSSHPPTFLRI